MGQWVAGVTAVEVHVLGPLELVVDDGGVRLPAAKQRRLLAALLVRRGETRSSDELIDAVWGESPPASARKLLQIYVSQLRKVISTGGRIVTRGSGYALELDGDTLDALRFERLLAEGQAALREENGALAASLLERALALWRGRAYDDFAYEDFARAEGERLEELRLVALEERVAAQLQLGRHADLLGEVRSLAAANPLRERLQAHAMLALYRSGRQTDALALYAATRARFRDELGLEPGPELGGLQQRILRQDPALEPAVGAAESPVPLPSAPNVLLGRERELGELAAMLGRSDVRLLVLTGAGGSGKTRLALELARRTTRSFANGAAFVELASVRDPGLVAAAIAKALEVPEVPGKDPLEALVDALRPRELLLVVDNAEHLRSAAPMYVDLVARVPRLTLVVTSRVVLHVSGEHVYPVEPLADEPAFELFVQRAREADLRFDPGREDDEAIRHICRRLDGLPLAIELAASHVRALNPAELLARLEPRLPLLTGGPRDLPARQQTLTATLQWSFELLEEAEQCDLSRLAVFAGGCTLEAAEAVAGTTVERLAVLVDHNLVRRTPSYNGSRYSLLETVREFALDQEAARGDCGRAHADYFLRLAERASSELLGPSEVASLGRLELEHDNLRAALSWMLESGEAELALQLASTLWRFWYVRAHFAEGRLWLERALGAAENPPPALLASALGAAARLTGQLGDVDAASAYAERSLELYRSSTDLDGLRSALGTLAVALTNTGALDRAEALQLEAIEIARRLDDCHGEAINVANLGSVALLRGDFDRAESLYRRSRAMFRELEESEPLWNSLFALALVALHRHRFDEAAELLAQTFEVCREVGSRAGLSCSFEGLAALSVARGALVDAARLLGCAQQLAERIGFKLETFEQALHDETVDAVLSALGDEAFENERELGRRMTTDEAVDWAIELTDAAPGVSAVTA
jgi:predicted ATPase/DNA-binding SARP family transcriptional activator